MKNDAYCSCLAAALGLSARDIAEIGGFSERYARDVLAGKSGAKPDLIEALHALQDDCDTLKDSMIAGIDAGEAVIWIFKDKTDLRERFRNWPGRGHAAGGFPGPMRIAALTALEALNKKGVEVSICFA